MLKPLFQQPFPLAESEVSFVVWLRSDPLRRQTLGILFGVVLLLAVLAVNISISLRATKSLIRRSNSVEQTRVITQELDGTLIALLNMETGERGYMYTGKKRYLGPYEVGKSEIDKHLNRLAGLTADNPVQLRNLEQVRTLLQQVMALFGEAITLAKAEELSSRREAKLSDEAKIEVDAVRSKLEEMKAEELNVLALRSYASQRSARYLLLAIPASQVFTAILLAIAGTLVNRDLRKRGETARQFRDLAHRERDARQLAETAHQHRESVLSSISEMFMLLDQEWRIVYVNDQVVRATGKQREELVGEDYWQIFPQTLGTKFESAYRRSMEDQVSEEFEAFDPGLRKWFSVHLYPSPDTLTLFAHDITQLKHTQDALVRTEKLAAVGRLAASVAHEINNPLEAVTNLIWLAKSDPSASESVQGRLALADEELKRVAAIAKQTLGFYRDTSAPARVIVTEVVRSVLALYGGRFANKRISIRAEYEDCVVCGFPGELRQLFSNLCANAIDAVSARGRLTVKVSVWQHGRAPAARVTIADDGCGIAPEDREIIFEPFFTTKAATGTGLGLWIAKEITDKHGGWILVRTNNEPDRHYTAVSVFLPLMSEAGEQGAAASA